MKPNKIILIVVSIVAIANCFEKTSPNGSDQNIKIVITREEIKNIKINQRQNRFSPNKNGLIEEKISKDTILVWNTSTLENKKYYKDVCNEDQNGNWRLPTVIELMSLGHEIEKTTIEIFPSEIFQNYLWTCNKNEEGRVWIIQLNYNKNKKECDVNLITQDSTGLNHYVFVKKDTKIE